MSPSYHIFVAMPKGRQLVNSNRVLEMYGVSPCSMLRYDAFVNGVRFTFLLLRPRDIPMAVHRGIADIGVTCTEWINEVAPGLCRYATLGWCRANLCLLSHKDAGVMILPEQDGVATIVTEFPRTARRYFAAAGSSARVVTVHGSAEAFPSSLCDFVVDVVETGETARRHELVVSDTLSGADFEVICRQSRKIELNDSAAGLVKYCELAVRVS